MHAIVPIFLGDPYALPSAENTAWACWVASFSRRGLVAIYWWSYKVQFQTYNNQEWTLMKCGVEILLFEEIQNRTF
jgi:hypothetical protein